MMVHKCDNCKKLVKYEEVLGLRHALASLELCEACAKPILHSLGEQQLLKPELVKELQAKPL